MAQREDGYNVSDTGNWNVASDFSRLKIMKPLDFCDHYENIAKFGHDSIMEELTNFNIPNDVLRLTGFRRLVDELLKLIGNVSFAMKAVGTQEALEKFKEILEEVKKLSPLLSETITNQIKKTQQLKINERKYAEILEIVLKVKSEINIPLNKNHLIFTDKKEFDPKEYKRQIIDGAINRG